MDSNRKIELRSYSTVEFISDRYMYKIHVLEVVDDIERATHTDKHIQ